MNPPTQPTTCIDDLPPEIISELFEYLYPKDLAACSLVNKRWHSIVAGFKMRRLAVCRENPYCDPMLRGIFAVRRPEDQQLCHPVLFKRLIDKPMLSNLKHLTLSWGMLRLRRSIEFDLSELNRFQRLVHLEISIRWRLERVDLSLPRLNVLKFHKINERCPLSIDCPVLSVLVYEESANKSLLDVKQPETIRKLDTDMVGSKLVRFKNVECLVTRNFEVISRATLVSLPRLRELHFNEFITSSLGRRPVAGTLDERKRTVKEFVHDLKLRGPDVRIRFTGFQLTEMSLDEIDLSDQYVHLKNYQLIDPDGTLDFINGFDYNHLMSTVPGAIPVGFLQRLTGAYFVQTSDVEAPVQDAAHFLWFLKSMGSTKILNIKDPQLGQEFYDQLPASAPSLEELQFSKCYFKKEILLNFDFVAKFPCLLYLSLLHGHLSFKSLSSLVRSSVRFEKFRFLFCYKGTLFAIEKMGDSKLCEVCFPLSERLYFASENLEEIVSYFEAEKFELIGKRRKSEYY